MHFEPSGCKVFLFYLT